MAQHQMDPQQLAKRQKEKAVVTSCDPFTVISEAKRDLYQGDSSNVSPWIEEALSRLEQTTRAGLGANASIFEPASQSS